VRPGLRGRERTPMTLQPFGTQFKFKFSSDSVVASDHGHPALTIAQFHFINTQKMDLKADCLQWPKKTRNGDECMMLLT